MVEQIIRTDAEGTPIEWRAGKRYPLQEKPLQEKWPLPLWAIARAPARS